MWTTVGELRRVATLRLELQEVLGPRCALPFALGDVAVDVRRSRGAPGRDAELVVG